MALLKGLRQVTSVEDYMTKFRNSPLNVSEMSDGEKE